MTRARLVWPAYAAWTAFVVLVAVQVHIAVRRPGGPDGMSDLGVYTGAVRTLLGGGSLYGFTAANGDQFVYPPVAGLLLVPVALLPDVAARVLWTLLQCGEVAVLAWAVVRRSPLPALRRLPPRAGTPVAAGVLMLTYPVFSGIFLGQVSLLVTLLALLDALDLTPRWCRGVATGLAAAVKLTPLAFVPYLWLTGRRRAAGTALATFVAASAVAVSVSPADSRRYLASLGADRPFQELGQADNASLLGLLTRTVPAATHGPALVPVLGLVVLLVLWSYVRARDAHARGQVLGGAVVVGALTVLVSPVSWSHHQVPLVLAAACAPALARGWARGWSVGILLLTSIPAQAVLLHLRTPGPLLRESSVLLALAIACAVPFRPVRGVPAGSRGRLLPAAVDQGAAGP